MNDEELGSWQRFFNERNIELNETATFYQFDCSYKRIVKGSLPEIFITKDDLSYILQFGPIEEIRYVPNNVIRISVRR